MKLTAERMGGLTFPLLAIGYASYSLWEQLTSDYMALTQDYALLINVPILLLGVAAMAQMLTERRAEEAVGDVPPALGLARMTNAVKPIALFVLSVLLVVSIDTLGYAIAFGAFVILALLIVGVRSLLLLGCLSLGIVALVHYVFVGMLRLQLPAGLLGQVT